MQDQFTATEALEILITDADYFTRVAANIVGTHDAEDVYQETAERLLRFAGEGRVWTASNRRAYVRRTVANVALERLRNAQERLWRVREDCEALANVPDARMDPCAAFATSEVAEHALAALPVRHRAVWLLHADGAPRSEIVTELGVPDGTIASWMMRDRMLLSSSPLAEVS